MWVQGKGYKAGFTAALRDASRVGWMETQGFTLGYFSIPPSGRRRAGCHWEGTGAGLEKGLNSKPVQLIDLKETQVGVRGACPTLAAKNKCAASR
jgi:hypothetical protein